MNGKIKNYLGIAIIIALLGSAVAFAFYVRAYSKSVEPTSFRSFQINGEGKVTSVPDVAQFTFSTITEGGMNLGDLEKTNTEKTNQAIEFMKSKNVDSKDIKTQNYDIVPRYQYYSCPEKGGVCPPPKIVGYTITQTVLVKIRDFKQIGDVLAGVIEKGANSVSGLSFVVDEPDKYQSEARAEAISKAKEKAEAVAKAGGFRLGRLLSITEGYAPTAPRYYDLNSAVPSGGAEALPSPAIEPGSKEITVDVSLTYEIK